MEPTIDVPAMGDIGSVVDLWVELAREQRKFGSMLMAEENRSQIRESFATLIVEGRVLSATVDGTIVGFISFRPEKRLYHTDRNRGFIQNLYVEPPNRGEGIGSALLRSAEDALQEAGCDTVALEAMVANADAGRFYRRAGYIPHRIEFEKSLEGTRTKKSETDNPDG